MLVSQLAAQLEGTVEGNAQSLIYGASSIDAIEDGTLVFLEKQKDAHKLAGSAPAAVLCASTADVHDHTLIRVANPRKAFLAALRALYPVIRPAPGIHPTAVISPSANIHPTASIGALCFVGDDAAVAADSVISPGCHIGAGASIGARSLLHPKVTILDRCRVGTDAIIHSGVVIGADGFGFVEEGAAKVKMPQVGNVVIGDRVEIGANTTIDRATLGSTFIASGTKLDNQVQIGHNVKTGENCIICGQAGIAGSSTIGDNVTIAGQAGIGDHLSVGSWTFITGKAGVMTDVPPKVIYSGFPAAPHRETMRIFSALRKLPALIREIEKQARADKG